MVEILDKLGYEIKNEWKLVGKVNGDRIEDAVDNFFTSADSKDTLLFYFTGHGIPDGHGDHFMASSDIDSNKPWRKGFNFDDIERAMKRSSATKIVTILDCCFSGAAGIAMGDEEDIAKNARVAMENTFKEGDGKCLLASSLGSQQSFKMKNQDYSLFTYYLIEGLNGGINNEAVNNKGFVTPSSLGDYVYHKVISADKRQKPIMKTAMSGNIVLAYYPNEPREKNEASPTASAATSGPDPIVLSARDYFKRREYERAIVFFDRVLESNPKHIEALNHKGICCIKLKRYDEARNCFNKVLETEQDNIEALDNLDRLKEYEGEAERRDSNAEPTDTEQTKLEKMKQNATKLLELQKYQEALTIYNQILNQNPSDVDSLKGKAASLFSLDNYDEALVCYKEILKIKPSDVEALNNVKLLQRIEKQKRVSDTTDSLFNEGVHYYTLGKFEEAMSCFERVLQINPSHYEARSYKNLLLERKNQHKKYADEIAESDDPSELIKKADYYINKRMYDEALACSEKALEIEPNYSLAWFYKGYALSEKGVYEESIDCYDKATKIDPSMLNGWNNKGVALDKLGRYKDALDCFEKELEVNPDNKLARDNKKLMLQKLGQTGDSDVGSPNKYNDPTLPNYKPYRPETNKKRSGGIRSETKLESRSNPEADKWFYEGTRLAANWTNKDDHQRAIECFDKALAIDPNLGYVWKYKGYSLNALNRKDEAQKCFRKAKELGF